MGRPSKCRICGYRFKQGEDICPECFTARDDDISCEQFSHEEHTHGGGFSTTDSSDVYTEFRESSFVDEQLRNESSNPIPDKTYGGKFGNPPPTYSQQTYKQESSKQNDAAARYAQSLNERMQRLNAIRNGTFRPNDPNSASRQGYGNGNQFYTVRSSQARKRNSGIVAVVIIIFIISFFLPVIIGIATALNSGTANKEQSTKRPLQDFSYELSIPDVSFPEISIPDMIDPNEFMEHEVSEQGLNSNYTVTANHFVMYEPFTGLDDTNGPVSWEEYVDLYDDSYADKNWSVIRLDVKLENNAVDNQRKMELGGILVETYDVQGNKLSGGALIDHQASYNCYFDCYFLVPEDAFTIELNVPTSSYDYGDETVKLNIPSYDFLQIKGDKPFE